MVVANNLISVPCTWPKFNFSTEDVQVDINYWTVGPRQRLVIVVECIACLKSYSTGYLEGLFIDT